ncbi:hypothetical protein N0V84_002203 [Fusarium piperis]|uniref:Uncharacterized protein n=1 Tax=Fusarium piperis TaxID=1435070 RepID=A0A9W8WJT5_9HYPO|nr:hypothetical protein N0V84_002203 [Fusarium piperis]
MTRLQIMLLVSHEHVPIPGHWAIFVAPEVTKEGTLFYTVGDHARGFTVDVKKNVCPTPQERVTAINLGFVDESKLGRMEEIANSTPKPVSSCQIWAQWFAQKLVEEGILQHSAMAKFRTAPRT